MRRLPLDVLKQRLVVRLQPARLGAPVGHLDVDILMQVAIPRRLKLLAPAPLQRRGQ